MIKAIVNKGSFDYDIHSLIKAFYPQEDVTVEVTVPETEEQTPEAPEQGCRHRKGGPTEENESEALLLAVCIRFDDEQISVSVLRGDSVCAEKSVSLVDLNLAGQKDVWDVKNIHGKNPARYELKNRLKRLLYRVLADDAGRELPWGNLTGIRPTKIPMALLEQGWTNVRIAQHMREAYQTSREKTALAISIANRERHILKDIDYARGYSLYIGIPFCPSICLYCSFSSSPIGLWQKQTDAYLDALCREIRFGAEAFADRNLNTVYIGGGTPTTLSPAQLDRLLTEVENCFDFSHLLEYTVEAGRPDSITREKLEVLRAHDISRISINPQTMNQKTLDLIGRRHTVEETLKAYHLARSLGFDNINMDLIVGLPGEGIEEVRHTMEVLKELSPDNITVHSLAVKRSSRLHLNLDQYRDNISNSSAIMDMTARYAAETGCFPYYLYRQKNMAGNFENVGYAKEGKAGIYNILIMEEVQSILALGAGASTKFVYGDGRIERVENVKDIRSYLERLDEMIERKRRALEEYKGVTKQ